MTIEEKSLCILAKECSEIATEISEFFKKTAAARPKSWASSIKAGLKSKKYEGGRRRLFEKLGSYRSQLDLQLAHWTGWVPFR
jgi:hypothetical protein